MRARLLAPYGVLAFGAAIVLLAHWPGRLNPDSRAMFAGVRGDLPIVDHWTATLTWVWQRGHQLFGLDVGGVFLLQTVALLGGVYLVLRAAYGRMPAAVLAVLVLLAPPAFGFVGLVGRDAWFLAGCVLAAGLAVAATRWAEHAPRKATVAVAAGFLTAAAAIVARQNGFTAVVPLFVGLAVPAVSLARAHGLGRAWGARRTAVVVCGLSLATSFAVLATSTLTDRVTRDRALHPETMTYLYDLGYLTLEANRQLVPHRPNDVLLAQTPATVRERWRPTTSLLMRAGQESGDRRARGFRPLSDAEADRIARAWRTTALDAPGDYLRARFGLWLRQIGIGHTPAYVRALVTHPGREGYQAAAFPGLSAAATSYAGFWGRGPEPSTLGGPLHHVWVYLLVCLLSLTLLLPRFPLAARVAAALPAAAIGLQVGLFFLAPSVQWRYQLLVVYAAMIALALVVRVTVGPTLLSAARRKAWAR